MHVRLISRDTWCPLPGLCPCLDHRREQLEVNRGTATLFWRTEDYTITALGLQPAILDFRTAHRISCSNLSTLWRYAKKKKENDEVNITACQKKKNRIYVLTLPLFLFLDYIRIHSRWSRSLRRFRIYFCLGVRNICLTFFVGLIGRIYLSPDYYQCL